MKRKQQQDRLIDKHRNVQRLIRSLQVINPFVEELGFPSHRLHLRRDHEKYLTLINTLALLHQHQREIKILKLDSSGLGVPCIYRVVITTETGTNLPAKPVSSYH